MAEGILLQAMNSFEVIFEAFNEAKIRYVVVGGLAVVLHGYTRLTADIDLIIDLDPNNAKDAIEAALKLGFKARPPVDPRQFADAEARQSWIKDKGMKVFSFYDPKDPIRNIDFFAQNPIPFEELWKRAKTVPLSQTLIKIASIADLISLKKIAGRPVDMIDIAELEKLKDKS